MQSRSWKLAGTAVLQAEGRGVGVSTADEAPWQPGLSRVGQNRWAHCKGSAAHNLRFGHAATPIEQCHEGIASIRGGRGEKGQACLVSSVKKRATRLLPAHAWKPSRVGHSEGHSSAAGPGGGRATSW